MINALRTGNWSRFLRKYEKYAKYEKYTQHVPGILYTAVSYAAPETIVIMLLDELPEQFDACNWMLHYSETTNQRLIRRMRWTDSVPVLQYWTDETIIWGIQNIPAAWHLLYYGGRYNLLNLVRYTTLKYDTPLHITIGTMHNMILDHNTTELSEKIKDLEMYKSFYELCQQ